MSRKVAKEFPGASNYMDRHGTRRWRYRQNGFSRELGREYASPEFVRRYEEARTACLTAAPKDGGGRVPPRSISALISEYYRTANFKALQPSTKATYRGILERFREGHGAMSVAKLKRKEIKQILDAKADTPSAANNLRDRMKALLDLALDLEWRTDNPVVTIKPLKLNSKGFHTWSETEISKYYQVHPAGTLAHTAMTLMLYTGAARVDAVKLGRDNIKDGRLQYRRQKTDGTDGILINLPIHANLAEVIDQIRTGYSTFLATGSGKARSPNGFGNKMREWCDQAGLKNCTSHGLRKAIARRLAEASATPHEIMSVTGHLSLAEVTRYTIAANRGLLADVAIARL